MTSTTTSKRSSPDHIGRVSMDISNMLGKKLLHRSCRQKLIEKSILKDPNESISIQDRSQQLLGMLDNRPSRDRLQRLNVIKEDTASLSPSLLATSEKLKRSNKQNHLSNWLAQRPHPKTLQNRRIIIDEHEAAKLSSTKLNLEDFISKRPDRESLIAMNIFEEIDEEQCESSLTTPQSCTNILLPALVSSLSDKHITNIYAGWAHSMFLDDSGIVYSVGSGANGHLGHGDTTHLSSPKPIDALKNIGAVTNMSIGMSHNAAIIAGQVYTWGEGQWGRLGLGDTHDRYEPTAVVSLQPYTIVDVACGSYHTLALGECGDVFAFGWNKGGRLGLGSTNGMMTSHQPVALDKFSKQKVTHVFAGSMSSAALNEIGELYTWGMGSYGVLGHGNETSFKQPEFVKKLADYKIIDVAICEYHMLALSSEQIMFSWGRNDFHQLGHKHSESAIEYEPNQVCIRLQDETVQSVSCGKEYSIAVIGNRIYSWGNGNSSSLGHGENSSVDTPKLIESIQHEQMRSVRASWSHTIACTTDGKVYAWGKCSNGQLGIESTK